MSLGQNVRRRRQRLGLTLAQLAERCDVSVSMLSEIERELKNPTINTALLIAQGLDCPLSILIDESPRPPHDLVRESNRAVLVDPESGAERYALSNTARARGLEILWYVIPPGSSVGPVQPHERGVWEHVTVLKGKLEVVLGNNAVALASGDSLSYDADIVHTFNNHEGTPCRVIMVMDWRR